jgi:aminomethyltransferase
MNDWLSFLVSTTASDELVHEPSGHESVRAFMMREIEYGAMARGVGLADRSERGLIEVRGADRLEWCHNLLTNQIKNLQPGDGTYAFAVNLQGRIVFDCVVTVRREEVWLDVDRSFVESAIAHLSKYIVVEDVELADRSRDFVRLGLAGPRMGEVMTALGASNAAKMPWWGNARVNWDGVDIPFLRNDFCGPAGVELFVPAEHAEQTWSALTSMEVGVNVVPTGRDAVETHRIESGILRSGFEIDAKVVAGETLQLEKAVSSTKGCYLGQEVVERMRTRGSLARCLVGFEIDGSTVPPHGAAILDAAGKPVGRMTSACDSIAKGGLIGMGYVRTAVSEPGAMVKVQWDGGEADAVVSRLPFVQRAEG